MKILKFKYKNIKWFNYAVYCVGLMGVIVLFDIDIYINKYYTGFFMSLLLYIYSKILLKKTSINIKEISIENNNFNFVFFNKKKNEVIVKKDILKFKIDDEKIIFTDGTEKGFIGIAYKKMLEKPDGWEELIKLLG